ncbi:MAG: quinone-dependent dihydroorotate dehydrogenase, partial [Marinobacter alexandrii]
MYGLIRNLLFRLPPEQAHNLALNGLDAINRIGLLSKFSPKIDSFPVNVMGLDFPNPVGLAAGLDKNADHLDALGALGFGFIEVGTVTPLAQPGNPKPRMFRLPEHQAIINRMGFNNEGLEHLLDRVDKRRYQGVLGINVGKNKDTPNEESESDYR